jgi:hypothetical protein
MFYKKPAAFHNLGKHEKRIRSNVQHCQTEVPKHPFICIFPCLGTVIK